MSAKQDHIVEANKMVASPAAMSADIAPAAMPGVEEIADAIDEYLPNFGGSLQAAHAVLDLFAPVLAEKERWNRLRAERHCRSHPGAGGEAMRPDLKPSLALLKSYYAGEIKEPNHDAIDDAYSVVLNFLSKRGIQPPTDAKQMITVSEDLLALEEKHGIRAQG